MIRVATFMFAMSLSVLSVAHSFAGGWVSSGGELFQDAKNPWFVRNTPVILYCLQIDSAGISADEASLRAGVVEALLYWREEFARATLGGQGTFEVATQQWTEVPCASGTASVTFKFGYGTLNPQEIAFLQEPRRYIGVAVRTDYSLEQLRARGFIYIASDQGPWGYFNPGNLINRAWSSKVLLRYALLHEIGHVLGLAHEGQGLMSEVFLDQLLNPAIASAFEDSPLEGFLIPRQRIENCLVTGPEKTWFQIPLDAYCVALAFDSRTGPYQVQYRKLSGDWIDAGEIRNVVVDRQDDRSKPAVFLHLPEQQTVFSGAERNFRDYMVASRFSNYTARGVYALAGTPGSIPKSVILFVQPNAVQVIANISGRFTPVFDLRSILSFTSMEGP